MEIRRPLSGRASETKERQKKIKIRICRKLNIEYVIDIKLDYSKLYTYENGF